MNKRPIHANTQTHTLQLPLLLLDSSRSTRSTTRRRGRKGKGREMAMVGASLSLPLSLSPSHSLLSPLCRRREGFSSLHQHHHQRPFLVNHKVQVLPLHLLPVPRIQMLFPRRDGGFMGIHATNPKVEIVDSYTAGSGARDPKAKDWLMPLLLMALAGAAIVTVVLTSRTNGAWVTFGERLNHGSASNDALFTLNLFGVKVNLAERTPGWAYFWLLMAAGFGLFVSEEALNVWVGATLARLLIFDGTWGSFLLSFQQNYQYIISTVLWVYWGVCISDMVPFYVGKFASNTKSSDKLREKIGVSKEKLDHIKETVQRYGNLIGFVERFSIGVRNPTSFLAGAAGISPSRFFTGVCLGGLITLPVQLGIGCALRDRPIVALAGVAAVMGLWTILPYVVAGFASVFYIIRKKIVK